MELSIVYFLCTSRVLQLYLLVFFCHVLLSDAAPY